MNRKERRRCRHCGEHMDEYQYDVKEAMRGIGSGRLAEEERRVLAFIVLEGARQEGRPLPMSVPEFIACCEEMVETGEIDLPPEELRRRADLL